MLQAVYGYALVWGLVACFCGYPVFRLMLALGFASLSALLGAYLVAAYTGQDHWVGLAAGAILGGLLGAVLAYTAWKILLALGGVALAVLLVTPLVQGMEPWLQILILFLASLGAAVAAVLLSELMIRLTTALLGASRAVCAVWTLFLGGPDWLGVHDGWRPNLHSLTQPSWVLFASLILAVLGFTFQMRTWKPVVRD